MSEADGVAKRTNPELTATRIDNGPPDPDVTLDTPDTPKDTPGAFTAAVPPAPERTSEARSIGPYQLIRKLGEGGMGQVWLAEQTAPIHRQVALKLIRVGRYDDAVLQRFYAERQSLAMMDHPAIAKVFDAGATSDGQPYFVMEYVPGQPITDYCDSKRLNIRKRLELFIKVCEGVQHAHQKAVMHRDLKPANILVVEVDGKPMPRIIDFGLAKTASPQLDGETLVTQAGGWVGTPGYMSPEQADPGVMDVDTRTDVYSLGAVLYVLLTGSRPFENKSQRFDEFLRWLREEDPLRPSTRVDADKETSRSTEACGAEPEQLVGLLRGDLDWITMKALERDRARRYGSPLELAADIGRYLANEPVIARPASVGYRARKYVLRHKALVAGTSAVFLVLVAGVITSTWEAVKARRAEVRSKQESAIAQAVSDFLQNDLLAQASANNQSGPSVKPDPDLKVRTALDRAAQRIEGKFAKQPEVEAAVRDTIGQTYNSLGIYPEARKQLERALTLRRNVLGQDNPETLRTQVNLGRVALGDGKFPEAEELFSKALDASRRVLGPENPDTLRFMNRLGSVYYQEGKLPQSEATYASALETARRVLGPDNPDTLDSLRGVAVTRARLGKYSEAETSFSQLLEIQKRRLGPEHPATIDAMKNLASIYNWQAKYAQSEALYTQTIEIATRVLGPEHPDTLACMGNLAGTYDDDGKYAESEALQRKTLELRSRVLGPEHRGTLWSMQELTHALFHQRKFAEAAALDAQALEIQRKVLGPDHPDTLDTMNSLSLIFEQLGKFREGETLSSQTLEIQRRSLGPESPDTLQSLGNLASFKMDLGEYAEAETLCRQAMEVQRRVVGPEHPETLEVMDNLGLALMYQGKYGEAESVLNRLLEIRRRVSGAENPDTLLVMQALAATYQRQGKYAQADPLYAEALASRRKLFGPANPDTLDTMADFSSSYLAQSKFSLSEPLAREAVGGGKKARPDGWQTFFAQSLLGASLAGNKKYTEAEPLLLQGYRGMLARRDRIAAPDRYRIERSHQWLVKLYKDSGKPDKASEVAKESN
jgi:eukaryotic-like serine/threonine-protein kinase